MNQLWRTVAEFTARCDGQDLIEYGLLAALIAVVAVAAMLSVGNAVNQLFYQTFPSAI